MKTNKRLTLYLIFFVIIILTAGAVYYFVFRDNKSTSKEKTPIGSLSKNLSPELEKLPENTVIVMNIKDSFVLPKNYRIDSQLINNSVLIYPKDQTNVQYSGLKSLESLQGIFITSANTVKNDDQFNKINQEKFNLYKKMNPTSDATSKTAKDKQGNTILKIQQTKPFKMVETILNKEYIIEIASFEESDMYQKVIDSYSASEIISENDHKAITKLHKNLIEAYLEHDGAKIFSLLSPNAQKSNPIEKIKKMVEPDTFKDMISFEPTIVYYFNGNFVLQSKVIFTDNYMSRVDISLKVDYDGKTNNWSIDSYSIKNKEKYLSSIEVK